MSHPVAYPCDQNSIRVPALHDSYDDSLSMLTVPTQRILRFGFIAFVLIGLEQGLLGLFVAELGTKLARSHLRTWDCFLRSMVLALLS